MKRCVVFPVLFAVIVAGISAQAIDLPAASVYLERPELITVNQLKIQIALLQSGMQKEFTSREIEAVLDSMIAKRLIGQAADAAGIKVTDSEIDQSIDSVRKTVGTPIPDDVFLSMIEVQMGMSFYEYREQIRDALVQQKYILHVAGDSVRSIMPPTRAEIDRLYATNIQSFVQPQMILLSHIFFGEVPNSTTSKLRHRETAESVHERLRGGKMTFAQAVSQFSQDPSSKLRNGRLGYVAINDPQVREMFGDEFVDYAFDLPVREISPVVTSLAGLHVLMVDERLPAKLLALSDPIAPTSKVTVEQYIGQQISIERQRLAYEDAYRDVVTQLKEEAEIRVFEKNIEDLS